MTELAAWFIATWLSVLFVRLPVERRSPLSLRSREVELYIIISAPSLFPNSIVAQRISGGSFFRILKYELIWGADLNSRHFQKFYRYYLFHYYAIHHASVFPLWYNGKMKFLMVNSLIICSIPHNRICSSPVSRLLASLTNLPITLNGISFCRQSVNLGGHCLLKSYISFHNSTSSNGV